MPQNKKEDPEIIVVGSISDEGIALFVDLLMSIDLDKDGQLADEGGSESHGLPQADATEKPSCAQ